MNAAPSRTLSLDQRPRLLRLGVGRVPLPGPEWISFDLPDYWSLHLYRYRALLRIDGADYQLQPGLAGLAPPGTTMSYRWGKEPSEHIYVLFKLPSRSRLRAKIPALFNLGAQFERIYGSLLDAIGYFPAQPVRAEVRLWDVLWELEELGEATMDNPLTHPAVREAQRYIEQRLGGIVRAPAVARHVELSQNHLIRLFNAQFGTSIAGYIRRRRIEHARYLLTRSTLPVKAVAAEVGIADLHLFNKTIRRELGASPRKIRSGARSE